MSTNAKKAAPKPLPRKQAQDKMSRTQVFFYIVRSLLLAAVLVAVLAILIKAKPGMDYKRALRLTKRGQFDEAMATLLELEDRSFDEEKISAGIDGIVDAALNSGDFDTADSLIVQVKDAAKKTDYTDRSAFGRAEAYAEAGRYAEAARCYYSVYTYRDSREKYNVCRCAMALESYEAGDIDEVCHILTDMPDVEKNVRAAAILMKGSAEKADGILAGGFFTEGNLKALIGERMHESFLNAMNALPEGRIAVGKGFTVGIDQNGNVLVVGSDEHGIMKLADTEDAVMVAAGTDHAAVLKKDGTVTACGANGEGQCDVGSWSGIVSIACAGYDTIGVKSDGSVVAAGQHKDEISKWHDVKKAFGGAYTAACLSGSGTMTSTSVTAVLSDSLLAASACGPVAAGIRTDEKLVTTIVNFPAWEGIISVKTGNLGIFAIDEAGAVHGYFYRATDAFGINVPEKAVEIEVGGTHLAILGESGKVYCFGNDDSGQCDTGSWNCK